MAFLIFVPHLAHTQEESELVCSQGNPSLVSKSARRHFMTSGPFWNFEKILSKTL